MVQAHTRMRRSQRIAGVPATARAARTGRSPPPIPTRTTELAENVEVQGLFSFRRLSPACGLSVLAGSPGLLSKSPHDLLAPAV